MMDAKRFYSWPNCPRSFDQPRIERVSKIRSSLRSRRQVLTPFLRNPLSHDARIRSWLPFWDFWKVPLDDNGRPSNENLIK